MAETDNRYDKLESMKSSFSNKEPFRLPDNYFENLNKQVLQAIEEPQSEVSAPQITVWLRLRPIVYMAAMFASLFLIIKFVVGDNGSNKKEPSYANNHTSAEIEVLHDYMASKVDEYSIYESYQEYSGESVLVSEASFYE